MRTPPITMITFVFVVCKVLGFSPLATWSWLAILSPLWVGKLADVSPFVAGLTKKNVQTMGRIAQLSGTYVLSLAGVR